MNSIKIGDIVSRKSHNHDILFKIVRVKPDGYVDLKGLTLRLKADAPIDDLTKAYPARDENLAETRERLISARKRTGKLVERINTWRQTYIPGKISDHT